MRAAGVGGPAPETRIEPANLVEGDSGEARGEREVHLTAGQRFDQDVRVVVRSVGDLGQARQIQDTAATPSAKRARLVVAG